MATQEQRAATTTTTTTTTSHTQKAWDFYHNTLHSPKFALAPMVDYSLLPFRLLVRKYGCQLVFTPMFHSNNFLIDPAYRATHFSTCPEDVPVIAQFCGNDPEIMVRAAELIQDQVAAVDVNLGCPQKIAKKGHYGAFIAQDIQRVRDIVTAMSTRLRVPITCKMRLFPSLDKSIAFARMLEECGCSLLTVHGRTKEQKSPSDPCDWTSIAKIKESVSIPVFANGAVRVFEDIGVCLKETNAEGVMCANGIIANPALFSGHAHCPFLIAKQFLDFCRILNQTPLSALRGHLCKMLKDSITKYTDLRAALVNTHYLPGLYKGITIFEERYASNAPPVPFTKSENNKEKLRFSWDETTVPRLTVHKTYKEPERAVWRKLKVKLAKAVRNRPGTESWLQIIDIGSQVTSPRELSAISNTLGLDLQDKEHWMTCSSNCFFRQSPVFPDAAGNNESNITSSEMADCGEIVLFLQDFTEEDGWRWIDSIEVISTEATLGKRKREENEDPREDHKKNLAK